MTGRFYFEMLYRIDSELVNQRFFDMTQSPEAYLENHQYILTTARKMGCLMLVRAEDLASCVTDKVVIFSLCLLIAERKYNKLRHAYDLDL